MSRVHAPTLIACAALFAALAIAPQLVNPGVTFLIGLTMANAVFALSWNLLFRYAGLASFGHAMFYGIGAYTTAAFLFHNLPVPFLLVIVISVLLGGLAAFIVGLIVLPRASGIQLAVLTLALSQLVLLFVSYTNYLGRDDGLSGLRRPRLGFGPLTVDLTSPSAYYYFMLIACGIATALLLWFVSGRYGRTMLAMRIDPERAAFIGINVNRQRIAAFTIAGAVAALCGALVAPWAQIVATDTLSWLNSAQPMLATLLGGAGSFWGPVIGAMALAILNYLTRTMAGLSELMVGGILIIVVLVAPAGLHGLGQSIMRRWRRRSAGPAQPPRSGT